MVASIPPSVEKVLAPYRLTVLAVLDLHPGCRLRRVPGARKRERQEPGGLLSEAEIYVMKARLHGGILSKALRGELRVTLPTGLVYDTQKKVQLDPDKQVQ